MTINRILIGRIMFSFYFNSFVNVSANIWESINLVIESIIATETSIIYFLAFGQRLDIPLERITY